MSQLMDSWTLDGISLLEIWVTADGETFIELGDLDLWGVDVYWMGYNVGADQDGDDA